LTVSPAARTRSISAVCSSTACGRPWYCAGVFWKSGDAPLLPGARGHERLQRVRVRVHRVAPGRHHPDDRTEDHRIRPDCADLAHPGDVGRGLVVGEDNGEVLSDLVAGRLAPVEADRDAVVGEQRGERIRVARIPGVEEARVEVARGGLRLGGDPRYASTSR
jgi:hypothetical protein